MTIADSVTSKRAVSEEHPGALAQANSSLRDVVRVTYMLPGRGGVPAVLGRSSESTSAMSVLRDDDFGGIGRFPDADRNRSDARRQAAGDEVKAGRVLCTNHWIEEKDATGRLAELFEDARSGSISGVNGRSWPTFSTR